MSAADFDLVLRVHLRGTWLTCRAAAQHWRERSKTEGDVRGRIVNATSGAGLSGHFGQTNYAAAKSGIVGLSLTLRLELARMGVTVNVIGPGAMTRISADAARAEILPRITRGEAFCSLGYTEPSGGSDVFAAKTSAVPDGDDWLVNGQKIFTSQGHIADYCLMLARTGPDKYAGLTLFVVPLDQPGYRFTEVKTIGDDRTNITFYDNVRVPDKYRLGEVHGGVKVMAAALTMEQSGGDFYTAEMKHVLKHGLAWARAAEEGEDAPITDLAVRRGLAEVKARLLVLDSLSRRCVWAASVGAAHKSYGPMCKLFGSESWVACTALLMRLAAPRSLMREFSALGEIEKRSRRAIPGTIYAGTSEIQRSLIAESALRLPRTRS